MDPDKKVNRHELSPPRANILGVMVSAINLSQALDVISGWIARRDSHYVCVTPAHSIMDCHGDPSLRSIFNASGLTTPDGMAIVWLLRLKGYRHVDRVYGPDLMLALCERSLSSSYRHFFYGSTPEVLKDLVANLCTRFPGLRVAGTYSPPFLPLTVAEDEAIIQVIKAACPDILWVGLGSPRQERWMADHIDRLDVPVLIGVGAAFDFLSGHKPQAPYWMQRGSLEWLYRLASEPGRLWRRYLRYPQFVFLVFCQMLGLKRYNGD